METPSSTAGTSALRLGATLLLSLSLGSCGGSSNDSEAAAPDTPPESTPTSIQLLDSQPEDGVTRFDPGISDATLSHFGYSDFTFDVSGDCVEGATIRHSLVDTSTDFDALFQHALDCNALDANGAFETVVDATRDNGESFETRLDFSTATRTAPALQVQDAVTTPRETVSGLFQTFVDDSVADELGLPDALASLVGESVTAIADAGYGDLVNAEPLFGVTAQRVSYASRRPDGNASNALTGLVVFPDTSSGGFAPRDTIIVLSHATGVTPSDLDMSDGWFVVANIFAARGYLVIAPDNWGRGGTDAEPETYLMGTRTAGNSLDLMRAVLADPDYDAVRGAGPPRFTIVGYSQGAHTALALWQTIAAQAPTMDVPSVYAGAGPHDLYATVRGVIQHANGTCDDDVYCRYVTDETTIPLLTEHVLPGYAEYLRSLVLGDVVDGETLTHGFVSGFLGNDPAFDAFKGLLQAGSFTNITAGLETLRDADTRFVLFHSAFDRLVPTANTEELVDVLEPHFTVEYRTDACSSDGYQAVFDATNHVGISHALCGYEVLNDVYAELR